MNDLTLGQLNHREDDAAPDTTKKSLSSSDGSPSLIMPFSDDIQQWINNLLPVPEEPAIPPFPGSFAPFGYTPFFDPLPSCLDDLLAFPPPFVFPASPNTNTNTNAPYSPSLHSQSGSSAAPTSPASTDAPLSSDSASSLSPTSWPIPTAFTPSHTSTATTTAHTDPSEPTLLETLVADTEADNLGVDIISLRSRLDPSYHAALNAAINSIAIAAATNADKPPKEALSPLLQQVDGRDKKDRRWFCRFRDCRWAEDGYNRSDRAIAHLMKDHFGTRFECKEPACDREFKWRHDLQAHVKRDHAPDGIAPARVLCLLCRNDFSKKSNLDRHLREGICPSFSGGPGKVKSKAPRTRKSRAATFRANFKPDEYDDDEYQVTHSNHRQVY